MYNIAIIVNNTPNNRLTNRITRLIIVRHENNVINTYCDNLSNLNLSLSFSEFTIVLHLSIFMSTVKEKVVWINKYLLDSMNSTDSTFRLQKQEDIEKYAKRLYLDSFCIMDDCYAWRSLEKKYPTS